MAITDPLDVAKFAEVLSEVSSVLSAIAKSEGFSSASEFELAVATALSEHSLLQGLPINYVPGSQTFPDIVVDDRFGVEVKFKKKDGWSEVANSVFEGSRVPGVEEIFVIFCKMGGEPGVRVKRYEDAIVHVRTSHVPRFAISMLDDEQVLFGREDGIPTTYESFRALDIPEKMKHVRAYSKRKHPGGSLWWIESSEEQLPSVETVFFDWTELSVEDKRRYAGEAVALFPEVLRPGRGGANKLKTPIYRKIAAYWLRTYGLTSGNIRDSLSAGSMALDCPEGDYVKCTIQLIEAQIEMALSNLGTEVFQESWGVSVVPSNRHAEWLRRADMVAQGWTPSKELPKIAQRAQSQ